MKTGELQIAWVKSLRENPEKKMKSSLGRKNENNIDYKACCLGELLLTDCRLNSITPIWSEDGYLLDRDSQGLLSYSYKGFGLFSSNGEFKSGRTFKFSNNYYYSSLASANDGGIGWVEIADFIEANPENVFTKEVANAFIALKPKKPLWFVKIYNYISSIFLYSK